MSAEDPRCPECGGKIGRTATYCMHCQTDLTGDGYGADNGTDDSGADRGWDDSDDTSWADQTDPTDALLGDDEPSADDGIGDGTERRPNTASDPTATADPATAQGPTTTGGQAGPGGGTTSPGGTPGAGTAREEDTSGGVLDPDGIVDNTLTVIVGIAGGIVIGLVGTFTLFAMTGSGYSILLGFLVWVASTAHLVRRRTVQGAVSRSAYGVAIVLLLIPLVFLSPLISVDGGIDDRIGGFVAALIGVAIPAGFAAVVGWIAGRFVPEQTAPR